MEKRIFWLDEEVSDYTLDLIKYIIKWNEEDDDIDVKNSEIIANNYSDAKLITFPKAEHVKSYSVDKEKYVRNITEFILQE